MLVALFYLIDEVAKAAAVRNNKYHIVELW
jgi:hypothetical protein